MTTKSKFEKILDKSPIRAFGFMFLITSVLSLFWLNFEMRNKADSVIFSIQSILRNELQVGDFGYIARDITDLYNISFFDCLEARTSDNGQIIVSLYGKKLCSSIIASAGYHVETELKTIGNTKIVISFLVLPNFKTALLLLIICLIASLLISASYKVYLFQQAFADMKINLAQQVAHDIRAPLMALDVAIKDSSLSSEKKNLIVSASQRINSIADDLLFSTRGATINAKKEATQASADETKKQNSFNLVPSIQKIIDEKKSIYPEVHFEFVNQTELHSQTQNQAQGQNQSKQLIKVIGSSTEFERILSNLINNSIEAKHESRSLKIKISLSDYGQKIALYLKDNGKGIPQEMLHKIGQQGFTLGKEKGNGLGLFSGQAKIKEWGGSLDLSSNPEIGTMVTVTFIKS